jgi:hypothetical protein
MEIAQIAERWMVRRDELLDQMRAGLAANDKVRALDAARKLCGLEKKTAA